MCENGSETSIIGTVAFDQLKEYTLEIASMYRKVAYHSIEHAAHVTISVNKMLAMVIENEDKTGYGQTFYAQFDKACADPSRFSSTLGIGTDALMQFSIVFAAMIHDVAHTGISNRQLINESDDLAMLYNDQSVAEQNSISIAFTKLYEDRFAELRSAIAPDVNQRRRFRSLVIQMVMSTDIASPERIALTHSRWKEAFEADRSKFPRSVNKPVRNIRFGIKRALNLSGETIDLFSDNELELKSSAVIEQLIEAADIAHLMQSYQNFTKWNKRLYAELYHANTQGRGFDPSGNWFQGQIAFVDSYVLPLAKRLLVADVFGPDSDIFITLAHLNRRKWIVSGSKFCEQILLEFPPPNAQTDPSKDDPKQHPKLLTVKT